MPRFDSISDVRVSWKSGMCGFEVLRPCVETPSRGPHPGCHVVPLLALFLGRFPATKVQWISGLFRYANKAQWRVLSVVQAFGV